MDVNQNTDSGLIGRLKQGDRDALAELFSLHRERLWRLIHFRLDKRIAQRVDADDVLQEAYLDAARRLEHLIASEYASGFLWLRQIVNQTMIDLHRRHMGAQRRDARRDVRLQGGQYAQATTTSLAAQLVGDLTSPSQVAMRAELAATLEAALEHMDPIDREVLALRHFEELTNSEVADVLSIQPKAASIRYVRALARFREILAQTPGVLDEQSGRQGAGSGVPGEQP